MNSRLGVLLAALALSGCATTFEGIDQEIFVNVTPEHAVCNAAQRGEEVSRLNPATMSMKVPKSRTDLFITCTAQGYKNKQIRLISEASAWGVVGALTLDFGIIDYADGALNKYPGSIQIVMERQEAVATRQ